MFFFILSTTCSASIPFLQFPTVLPRRACLRARPAWSGSSTTRVGIARHGFVGYLKLQSRPGGRPGPILPLLVPLEFLSNLIVRPVTLSLRLFANMFAGHLLLILFATRWRVPPVHGAGAAQAGRHPGLAAVIAVGFLELMVQFLQAYVFILLNAMYISGALADEH